MCGRLGLATNTLRLFPDAVESCSRSFSLGCCVTCFDWKDVAEVMGRECQGWALRQLEASPFPLWEASCHALKNVIGSDQGFSIRKKIASGPLAMPGDIFWLSQLGVGRRMGEAFLWYLEGRSHWIFQRFYKQNTEHCLIGKKTTCFSAQSVNSAEAEKHWLGLQMMREGACREATWRTTETQGLWVEDLLGLLLSLGVG